MSLYNYEILPNIGIDEIHLGMTAEQIHQLIGMPELTKLFMYSVREYYQEKDIKIYYEIDEKTCIAITMGERSSPTYQGYSPIGKAWKPALEWLKSIDKRVRETHLSVSGLKTGIRFHFKWKPNIEGDATQNEFRVVNDLGDLVLQVGEVTVFRKKGWNIYLDDEIPEPVIDKRVAVSIRSRKDFDKWLAANPDIKFFPAELERIANSNLKCNRC